ncbi:MAG: hypothetical protein ACNA8H_11575 [Anaerolineales bacterium]
MLHPNIDEVRRDANLGNRLITQRPDRLNHVIFKRAISMASAVMVVCNFSEPLCGAKLEPPFQKGSTLVCGRWIEISERYRGESYDLLFGARE